MRRHLFYDVGGLLGFERFQNAGLDIRLHLGERVGGHFAVDGFEDGFTIVGAQIFDDVRQVGRMHPFEDSIADVQAKAALRVRLKDAAVLPADGMGRNHGLKPADQPARNHALRQAGGTCFGGRCRLQ